MPFTVIPLNTAAGKLPNERLLAFTRMLGLMMSDQLVDLIDRSIAAYKVLHE